MKEKEDKEKDEEKRVMRMNDRKWITPSTANKVLPGARSGLLLSFLLLFGCISQPPVPSRSMALLKILQQPGLIKGRGPVERKYNDRSARLCSAVKGIEHSAGESSVVESNSMNIKRQNN